MNAGLKETSAPTRTAIILVNWNGARDLLECLESLLRLETRSFDVFVCDNDSSDGSVEKVLAWAHEAKPIQPESSAHAQLFASPRLFHPMVHVLDRANANLSVLPTSQEPRIVVIRTGGNLGFAGGNNVGLRCALLDQSYTHFWVLNTDTISAPDALNSLLARSRQCPEAGMIGSTLLYYWFPDKVQAMGGASFDSTCGVGVHLGIDQPASKVPADPSAVESRTDYIVGASILVTRSFLERVGLMCEDYFLYYEEIDWAVRGKGMFSLAYAPNSKVFHKVGGSSRRQSSRAALRYLYRNRLRFMARFFPHSLPGVRRRMWLQILQHGRRGHWDDVRELWSALMAREIL